MTSVNTNAAALTALRTLQNTNQQLESVQGRISTGLKIGEAKDNAAYWSISTTLKSDNKSLATVKDALGLGAATVDVAYQGLTKAKDVLDEIKSKLTAASQDGVNRDTIQAEIKQLQDQLKSIASSSVFSGENWLSVDSSAASYNANKQIVASFSRDANGAVSIGSVKVDITAASLFDSSTAANASGILNKAQSLTDAKGNALSYGGTPMAGNKSTGGLAASTATGTDAVMAKSTFTGGFTATALDADDQLTLSFKTDNATNPTSIVIKNGDVSGAGIATAGTIGSVDELVTVINKTLKSNGILDVSAVKDGSNFALQRTVGGQFKSVEVTAFTGGEPADSAFGKDTLVTANGGDTTTGAAFVGEKQDFVFATTGTGGAKDVTITLATGEVYTLTNVVNNDTAGDTSSKIAAAINAKAGLKDLVSADGTTVAGTLTLTYKTAGDKGMAKMVSGATATTINGIAAGTTADAANEVAYVANAASDSISYTSGSTKAFKDADDKMLFQFKDSAVGGGTTQTVEITKADLDSAGISDGLINSKADLKAALAAAFSRQATSNSLFANYSVTLGSANNVVISRNGPGIVGQTIEVLNTTVDTITFVDPAPAITNTFGLTAATGLKKGANAVEASAANTMALPAGGIALDSDDTIAFDVSVAGGAAKTVKIDSNLVNTTLANASKAKAVMGQFDVSNLTNSDIVSFSVDWNGTASSFKISGLNSSSTIGDVVSKINNANAFAGASIGSAFNTMGTASVENGRIVFTALTAGASNSVKVSNVSNTNSFAGNGGLTAVDTAYGQDAVASANGTISTVAQYARVVNAALSAAGVAGAYATVSGSSLALTSTSAGSSSSVNVANVQAGAGANTISIDKLDISSAAFTAAGVASADQIKTTLSAYIGLVNTAINKITAAASNFGSVASRIDLQKSFVNTLMDTIDKGVGNLVDADMSEESTKLQALQVKQQLGTQSLSIANQSAQSVLSLFRG